MTGTPIELQGAVVAITGGARGIGRAAAAEFARRGARVAIGDLDAELASSTATELEGTVTGLGLDVAAEDSFARFIAAVESAHGPIDILVNNAGIMPEGSFLTESIATARAIFAVNVDGPIHGMKLVLPGMVERGRGHVVNVASYAGRFEIPGLASYCASKHAVVGLTGSVARELEGTGVTLTAILPSAVATDLSAGIDLPLERWTKVSPEQVAKEIVDSVDHRSREVAVPRWLAGYRSVSLLLPARLERLARRALRDDRALTAVDPSRRAAYNERIARQRSTP